MRSVFSGPSGIDGSTFSRLVRSGSANTMSNTIAAAPRSPKSLTISVMRERGQGHCPTAAKLASSMASTRTGPFGS